MAQSKMEVLLARLEQILQRQDVFVREIAELKAEIYKLQASSSLTDPPQEITEKPVQEFKPDPGPVFSSPEPKAVPSPKIPKKRSDIEKFIGENIINKIGIIITVLGVAIGVKYSVDNDLISPLTRVLLGYISGFALLGFGLKFRKKYENYSAVLVSGAIAILYFITYAAYSFYGIFHQSIAFGLMLIFTALTVITALKYNRQVIAHIGMVGAYAIPFLLGDESGNAWILFSYISIINLGILVIAFKRYWKSLFYAVFIVTWLVYLVWLLNDFIPLENSLLAILFAGIFFGIFYITFLAYKLIHEERYNQGDVGLLLANSFIFYGVGYYIISENEGWNQYLGLFTIANAFIHGLVAQKISSKVIIDRDLYYFITGLAIAFLTIAVPVQLEAGWVTTLWAGEAALLFWIGRSRNAPAYERIAYVVMAIAFISLLEDWKTHYLLSSPEIVTYITPLWNTGFLISMFFIIAFGFITYINRQKTGPAFPISLGLLDPLMKYVIPAVFLFSMYYAFRIEIDTYWEQRYIASEVDFQSADLLDTIRYNNYDLRAFKSVWIINYSMVFLILLSVFNMTRIKSKELGLVTIGFIIITLMVFLSQGLIALSDLWRSHLNQPMAEYYETGSFHIWIRYLSIAIAVLLLVITFKYMRRDFMNTRIMVVFDLFMHLAMIIILSSELFLWIDSYNPGNSFKLGLSILWGIYALFLIGLGIKTHKKHLRVAAIVLFALTLVKLFLYDIADLNTISKTIVFVCLGVLLLIISFLYNKYKTRIAAEEANI